MPSMDRRKFLGALGGGYFAAKEFAKGQEPGQKQNPESTKKETAEVPAYVKDLQVLVNDPQVKELLENIKRQLDTFKPKHGHMFDPRYAFEDLFEKIQRDLEYLKSQEESIARQKEFVTTDNSGRASDSSLLGLLTDYRDKTLKALKAFHEYVFPQNNFVDMQNPKPVEVKGFENLPNWSNERITKVVESLPAGYFYNIPEITFVDEEKKTETFGIAGEAGSQQKFNMDAMSMLGRDRKSTRL